MFKALKLRTFDLYWFRKDKVEKKKKRNQEEEEEKDKEKDKKEEEKAEGKEKGKEGRIGGWRSSGIVLY